MRFMLVELPERRASCNKEGTSGLGDSGNPKARSMGRCQGLPALEQLNAVLLAGPERS